MIQNNSAECNKHMQHKVHECENGAMCCTHATCNLRALAIESHKTLHRMAEPGSILMKLIENRELAIIFTSKLNSGACPCIPAR